MTETPLTEMKSTVAWMDEDDIYKVQFYETVIVEYDPDTKCVKLDTGGYKTKSTKLRMNKFFRETRLPYRVEQSGGDWIVGNTQTGDVFPFDRVIEFPAARV
jgi:hypothetical protein